MKFSPETVQAAIILGVFVWVLFHPLINHLVTYLQFRYVKKNPPYEPTDEQLLQDARNLLHRAIEYWHAKAQLIRLRFDPILGARRKRDKYKEELRLIKKGGVDRSTMLRYGILWRDFSEKNRSNIDAEEHFLYYNT